jgi:2-alkyl-3-oxoalkanoate reductase
VVRTRRFSDVRALGAVTGGGVISSHKEKHETEGAVIKVFVAGATGVLGRALVPQLVARGHEVVGMTRSESKQDLLRSLGARPVMADALDPDAVAQAVASAEPEAIVHQLTALSGPMSLRDARHPERSLASTMTNRLRTEATDHLLAAGRAVGARRFVAQSFAAFRFARTGGPVQTEADPLDPDPPTALRPGLAGILHVERAVPAIEWGEGLVLRYGGFYGPGTAISLAPDAQMAAPVRKRRFPIVGDGGGVLSHVHIEDAAVATAVAVDHGQPGIYSIVDDEPAAVREWLPVLASALGAKPPRRIPRWLGRLLAGEMATVMMTEVRGASNEKAKRELGWQPRYASWRQGFAQGLG